MTTHFSTLLRRTIAVAGALVALAVADETAAQTVTLSGTANTQCTWSAFAMQPNGSIAITCSSGGSPGPGPVEVATFTLAGPTTVATNSSPVFTVTRTNGPANQTVGFGYTVTGAGCQWVSQGPFFLAKDEARQLAVSPTTQGTCVITLVVQDGHVTVPTSKQMTITVGNTDTGPNCTANPSDPRCPQQPPPNEDWSQPVPIVSGCPTPDQSKARLRKLVWGDVMRAPTLPGQEYLNSGMNSGDIMAIKIPPSPSGRMSVTLTQGQGTVAPPQPVTELTVSRCPGVIETNLTWQCYQRTNAINFYSITAYNRLDGARGSDQNMYSDGCLAATGEQFYANVRWTFANCPWGNKACAFSLQWGEGAF